MPANRSVANKVRLLLVDDHEVVRLGLRTLFTKYDRIHVVGEAGTAKEAVAEAKRVASDEICVIGGSDIFRQMLPVADRLYLTEVDLAPVGDVHFPPLDRREWHETSREPHGRQEGDDAGFILRVLDRVSPNPLAS